MLLPFFQNHPQWSVVDGIARELTARGHRVVLAGGCVRDALLGLTAHDLDIATDATPEQVAAYFPKVLHIGKSFGVCRVVENGHSLEVATFREESDYQDGRRPEKVVYSTLEKDALRRDFTVNAMFFDLKTHMLIDLVYGQRDLKARELRAVGVPEQRFAEDHLRVLRGARFAAQLNFTLEPETRAAMTTAVDFLGKISRERVHEEIHKAFRSPRPWVFFDTLHSVTAFQEIFPLFPWDLTLYFGSSSKTLRQWLEETGQSVFPSVGVGWATLAWWLSKTALESVEEWLLSFKLSHDQIQEVLTVLRAEKFLTASEIDTLDFVSLAKTPYLDSIEFFWQRNEAVFKPAASYVQRLRQARERFMHGGLLPTPLVTGGDLLAAGEKPDARFKEWLDKAYVYQLENPKASKKAVLQSIGK